MKEIVEYTLAYGRDSSELISHVNALISTGWQPFSDIKLKTYTNQPPDLYQTMVKYKPEPKNSI